MSMEIPPHPPLEIQLTLGDHRTVLIFDASLIAEGREVELQSKMAALSTAIVSLAQRAGLRPNADAHFECVVAYNRAIERGDEAEAARLRIMIER